MMFQHASDELQVSSPLPNVASPISRTSRIPLSSARHTKFGDSQVLESKPHYSYRSPPRRHQEQGLRVNDKCTDKLGPKEPWSSGYLARTMSPDDWKSGYEHDNDIQYPVPSTSSPAKAKISEWLRNVNTESNPCTPTENAARALEMATGRQRHSSPTSMDSNKENTSPTRSFSPIQPPITHTLLTTPSRFRHPPPLPRIHSQTPSRFDHVCTPGGYLSTPPRRNRCRPADKSIKPTEDGSALRSSSNSTGSTLVNSDITAVGSPPIAIYRDSHTPQADIASPRPPASCSLSQAAQVEKRRDCTIPTSLISSALATLSPAVSISRKGKRGPRNHHSSSAQAEDEQKEIQDLRRGRPKNKDNKLVTLPAQYRAQEGHIVSDREDGSDDSEEERLMYSEKKVLRSGREVDVLGVSRNSEALCQEKPFTQDAEGKTFDFTLEDTVDHNVEA